jgi:hypothetical protein
MKARRPALFSITERALTELHAVVDTALQFRTRDEAGRFSPEETGATAEDMKAAYGPQPMSAKKKLLIGGVAGAAALTGGGAALGRGLGRKIVQKATAAFIPR